ncbi:hypothetical protein GVAV_001887 [Gurleya vavrai]
MKKHEKNFNLDFLSYEVEITYYLKCKHIRKIHKEDFIFILYVSKKGSLQKIINDLQNKTKNIFERNFLCVRCIKNEKISFAEFKFLKLPEYFLIEIERGFKKENQICFFDKPIKISNKIKFGNFFYEINSAILFLNEHYTTIVNKSNDFYLLDNNKYQKLTILEALKKIELHGRFLILRKEKQ